MYTLNLLIESQEILSHRAFVSVAYIFRNDCVISYVMDTFWVSIRHDFEQFLFFFFFNTCLYLIYIIIVFEETNQQFSNLFATT